MTNFSQFLDFLLVYGILDVTSRGSKEHEGQVQVGRGDWNRRVVALVQSESNPAAYYTVSIRRDHVHCTCPHHIYRQVRCKHADAAEAEARRQVAQKRAA